MKIGIVTPGGFDRSGAERVIPVFLCLAQRLARTHEVHVFTLRQGPDEEQYPLLGATVHNVGDRGGSRRSGEIVARTIHAIGCEHRRGRFTVLHGLWAAASGLAAAVAGKMWGIPTVVSVAGGEMARLPEIGYGSQVSLKARMEVTLCLRLADAVTSASEWMCRPIRQYRPDVRHVVMGVDTDVFHAGRQPDPTARAVGSGSQPPPGGSGQDRGTAQTARRDFPIRLPPFGRTGVGACVNHARTAAGPGAGVNCAGPGAGASEFRLLHVASLNRVKDQPTLLRAFREIVSAEPRARLDIVGVDTLDGAIQQFARDLGLDEAVTFHGHRRSDEVAAFLRQSHLLLHSSLSEMGPIVCLEAAACGVPTVGTAVGLIDDLAPRAAIAVPVGDHHALARAAIALLRDEPARRALGNRALAFARAHDAGWTASQFERIYARLDGPTY